MPDTKTARRISIVIPVLNDADALLSLAADLQPLKDRGHQVIVVDGGSGDTSMQVAHTFAHTVISSEKGRARQMNAGALRAEHDLLWFLHADSRLPAHADQAILGASCRRDATFWGRFDLQFRNPTLIFRIIAILVNKRSRLSGIATGDQGIFVSRDLFERCGAYPDIHLMEDIAISKNLGKIHKPVCLEQTILTSCRRWESNGIFNTIVLMWWLRFAYFFGVSPVILQRWYYAKS